MATRDQSTVVTALTSLKFKMLPPEGDPPVVGGPVKLKVTEKTLEFLKGKVITVDGDASVKARKVKE